MLNITSFSADIKTYATIIAGTISIGASLYSLSKYALYPYVLMPIINFFKAIHQTISNVQNINLIIKKELSTNGGSSIKDAINRIEFDLSLQDEKRKNILSLLEIPIWESDAEGNCIWINTSYKKLTGYDISNICNMAWLSIVFEDDREKVYDEWQSSIKEKRPFIMTYRIVSLNGKILKVHSEAHPIFFKNKISGLMGNLRLIES